MAAKNPFLASDLVAKYGWQIMPYLSTLGVTLLSESQILFVDSGNTATGLDSDDTEHGHSFQKPLLTVDYAVGLCTADQGDVILCAPNHTETLATAAILNVDVDDVSIIGMGTRNQRAKFTLSDTLATFQVDADNVTLKNLQFVSTKVGGTTVGVDVLTGSDYFTMENCYFEELANTTEILTCVSLEDKTDYALFKNCVFKNLGGNDHAAAIFTEADEHEFLEIIGCTFMGDYTGGACDLNADTIIYPLIKDCIFLNIDGTAGQGITIGSSTVATVVNCRFACGKATGYPISDVSASFLIGNTGAEVSLYDTTAIVSGSATNFGS